MKKEVCQACVRQRGGQYGSTWTPRDDECWAMRIVMCPVDRGVYHTFRPNGALKVQVQLEELPPPDWCFCLLAHVTGLP